MSDDFGDANIPPIWVGRVEIVFPKTYLYVAWVMIIDTVASR